MSRRRIHTVSGRWPWRLLPLAGLLAAAVVPAGAQIVPEPAAVSAHYYQGPRDAASAPGQGNTSEVCQGSNAQGPQQEEAQVPAVEKIRKLSRTFAANGRPFVLDTRYGRVQVNVWSRNEIRTDVDVITRSDTEEKAQQLQDMIQVQVQDNDPLVEGVSAKSRFGAMPRECWSRTKLYEVNYTVWVPKNTPLKLYNSFGEVILTGDMTGAMELAVEYGGLRTARLEGLRNLVRVGNGQCAIPYVRKASIDASYSKLRLTAGETVDLRNNYSDIDIGTVQDLTVHSKYGDVALGNVRNLRGTSGYSKFSIDKLSNQLDMTVQYCPNFEVRSTGKNFREINLDGGYSTIQLNFPDEASFKFDVNTDHGKLLVDKRLVRVASEESSASSSDMQGSFGAAPVRTTGNVNIKVRYGNVSFNK
jgi:hypothetical protein